MESAIYWNPWRGGIDLALWVVVTSGALLALVLATAAIVRVRRQWRAMVRDERAKFVLAMAWMVGMGTFGVYAMTMVIVHTWSSPR